MAPPDPAIERHRERLEASLEKLRKALRHWQIFSAEYEAFREELQELPEDASREDMLAVGTGFGGTVVDEKEIKALLGDKLGVKRSVAQVMAALGHRIDYVQENATKVEKMIEQGERKLEALLVIAAPDLMNDEGLPIMDIREELDEEDNVIVATINGNDPNAPIRPIDTEGLEKIVDVIEKEQTLPEASKAPATPEPREPTKRETKAPAKPEPTNPKQSKAPENKPKTPSPLREVTPQDQIDTELHTPQKTTTTPPEKEPTIISSKDEDGGGIVKILDDAPEVKEEDWVQSVPGESEEDAEMRREMLKYNMAEIGAVVAEINLDEDGDFYGYEDSDDYDEDEDDDDDEEDEYGRTKYKVVTPELQREMEELQRRVEERAEAARNGRTIVKKEEEEQQQPKKRGVRFAEELDIAPAPAPIPPSPRTAAPPPRVPDTLNLPPMPVPESASNTEDAIPLLLDLLAMDEARKAAMQPAPAKPEPKKPSIFKAERTAASAVSPQERLVPASALAPTVLERSSSGATAGAAPPAPPTAVKRRKLSRFAAEKAVAATAPSIYQNTTPHAATTPEDEDEDDAESRKPQPTMSSFIKEHAPSPDVVAEPPDELDPSIHRREVASEFHRMRTKMIQQQGGFVETEEEGAFVPLNEQGEKRKISRFKAARLKAMGRQE